MPITSEALRAQPGYLHSSFMEAAEPTWTPLTDWRIRVADGCADDRPITPESAARIQASLESKGIGDVLSLEQGYASMFGGQVGQAKTLLMAGTAVHGAGFIKEIQGLEGAKQVIRGQRQHMSMLHSDTASEQSAFKLYTHGGAIGCAYSMGLGTTAYYLADHYSKPQADREVIRHIQEVAAADQQHTFGHTAWVKRLVAANVAIDNHFAHVARALRHRKDADARDFSADRESFVHFRRRGGHVMILEGEHTPVEDTGLISNYDPGSVGSANKAAERGLPFYRSDIGFITGKLAPVLKLWQIPPSAFAAAAQYDSTAVRAILVAAQYENTMDPSKLALGVRGDAVGTLEQLDDLWHR